MIPNLHPFISWLIPVSLSVGLLLFLSSCGCCGKGGSHPKDVPCKSVFEERLMSAGSRSYPVNITKTKGRVVILMHEANGQSPGTLWLAKKLGDAGCKVYVPRFFGGYGSNHGLCYTVALLFKPSWHLFSATDLGCIRAEMKMLTEAVAKENPGKKVTVIGNCMTGSLPLELLQNEHVDTAIICQPALPFFAWTSARKRSMGLPEDVIAKSLATLKNNPDKRLIHFNYLEDHVGLIERSQYLAGQTREAKITDRHQLFIGVGPGIGDCCRAPSKKALPQGAHPLITMTAKGHSTVTGAKGEDLEIFRQQLFEALRLTPTAR